MVAHLVHLCWSHYALVLPSQGRTDRNGTGSSSSSSCSSNSSNSSSSSGSSCSIESIVGSSCADSVGRESESIGKC